MTKPKVLYVVALFFVAGILLPVALNAQAVSEEARRYMARGMAAVEMAKTPKDYERAVREFEQAAKLAPDWPDVYFNLGSIQAKAGNYGKAVRHYKRYLELAPNAPDAAKVREEIYKLEYRAEEEARVKNRFIAYSNGTVLDTTTDLMWAAKDNGVNINWANAKSYCENYRGGGYTDWRMPTLDELAGLYDAGKNYEPDCSYGAKGKMGINIHLTDLIRLTCFFSWSSETRGSEAAYLGFSLEQSFRHWSPQSYSSYVRALPVRSSKLEDNNPLPGSASIPSLPTGVYKGVRDYENGDKYEGEFTNRKPHGKGTYTCRNGKQFTGNFENNKPIGFTIICN